MFQPQSELAQQKRIEFHPNSRTRTAAHRHLGDAGYLGDLLRQDGVRNVVELRRRRGVGSQGDGHDVDFGGIHFAPAGIRRQVDGQLAARRINGRLNVASRRVNVAIQIELHGDACAAELAEGGHLRDARDAAEHALERGGNRGGHRFGACAWKGRGDGNRGIFNLGQRGDRKEGEGQGAKQEQTHAQQGSRHRPLDKWR